MGVRVPVIVAFALLAALLPARADVVAQVDEEAVAEELVVGVRVAPPFVIEGVDGGYAGITIELWEHIADELGLAYRYEERELEGLIEGLEDGSLDVSAAALTITADREERVDFSHPFYVTGLGIAVPQDRPGLMRAIAGFVSAEFLWLIVLLVGLLLFWGTLVWVFERVENADEFGGPAAHGIGSGFWWAAVTMTTVGYGDKAPRTLGGRIVGFIWMFTALVVISFFTASIASSLTVRQLDGPVSGPRDLPYANVGGLQGAAAIPILAEAGVKAREYPTIASGLEAVGAGELDAFVHDAPILRYQIRDEFRGRARVLPATVAEQYYGVALPLDSPSRGPVNRTLLDFLASAEWEQIQRRYLGDD
jgi:polar amino acid transport system substrate-binding protein